MCVYDSREGTRLLICFVGREETDRLADFLTLSLSRSVFVCLFIRCMCVLCGFVYQQPLGGSIRKTRARQDLLQPSASDCVTWNARTRTHTDACVRHTRYTDERANESWFEPRVLDAGDDENDDERDKRNRDP